MDTRLTTDSRTNEELYRGWTDGRKYILAQTTTEIELLSKADAIGTPDELYTFLKVFPHRVGTFFVDVPVEMLAKMRGLRPELQIRNLPKLG